MGKVKLGLDWVWWACFWAENGGELGLDWLWGNWGNSCNCLLAMMLGSFLCLKIGFGENRRKTHIEFYKWLEARELCSFGNR